MGDMMDQGGNPAHWPSTKEMIFNNQKIIGTKTYMIDGETYTVNVVEPFVKELPTGYVVVSEELWNKLRNFRNED